MHEKGGPIVPGARARKVKVEKYAEMIDTDAAVTAAMTSPV